MIRRAMLSLMACAACVSAAVAADAKRVLPHRSWQFHDRNWDHLRRSIPKAKAMGMSRIQLSHDIVMDAEQLWQGGGHEERLEMVRKAVKLAHEQGLAVDMWTHELSGVPKDRFREGGKVRLSPELWQWVDDKYEKLFELVPDLDGLVLTFAETDHKVYTDAVISDAPPPRRVARLIKAIGDVCARKEKLLIVRTFVYEPHEIDFLHQALGEVARDLAGREHIIVMTKCVPHDWTPYYPFNPLLGNVDGLRQVVEIDLGQEFTGQSKLLHCEVDYVKCVLDYAREKNVIGAVARVERHGNHALGTPNEVNIHAFCRLLHDGTLTADALWKEWAVARYGEEAAPHLIRALKRTFDATNLTYFPLEYWIVNHSRIPDWGYAYGHITSRENCKWIPSPKQVLARDELLRPTLDTIARIDMEKNLARALLGSSLRDLDAAKFFLSEDDGTELENYFSLANENVEIFRHHNRAMFLVLALQHRKNAWDATEEELKEIREEAETSIEALRLWANRMEQRHGKDVWPGNPDRLRKFADEAEKRLLASSAS